MWERRTTNSSDTMTMPLAKQPVIAGAKADYGIHLGMQSGGTGAKTRFFTGNTLIEKSKCMESSRRAIANNLAPSLQPLSGQEHGAQKALCARALATAPCHSDPEGH